MIPDDILDIKLAVDFGGVTCVSGLYYECAANPTAAADAVILADFAAAFWATIDDALSSNAILSCAKMVNVTTPAKSVTFPNLPGLAANSGHPPHQVLRYHIYGQENSGEPQIRNGIAISGVDEALSTRGRVNNVTHFAALATFLVENANLPNGVVLRPQVRKTTALGGPGLPDTYEYFDVQYVRMNEVFQTQRSRKYRLCI